MGERASRRGQGRFIRRSSTEMTDPALQKEIARRYQSGESLRQIRFALHCGSRTVKLALARHRVQERYPWGPSPSEISQRLEALRSESARHSGRAAAARDRLSRMESYA